MDTRHIVVQIDPEFRDHIVHSEIVHLVKSVLEQEGQPSDAGVTVVITDDARIHEMNRSFRGVDRPTDVLAFAMCEGSSFVTPDALPPYLGDVIVSYPRAQAQAADQGHPVGDELALLVVHGCLHLLDYDHADDKARRRMWARQKEILQSRC